MAFDIRFLGKVSSTANSKVQAAWSYISATDTIATIKADGYFNDAISLRVKDVLNIKGSNKHDFYIVMQIDPDVTIEVYEKFSMVGDWSARVLDEEYTESVDGFAHGWIESSSYSQGKLEAQSPVGTNIATCETDSRDDYFSTLASVTIPVKAGDSWKMIKTNGFGNPDYTIVFMPFTF